MRRRTYFLYFLFVLAFCLAFAVSSAMADVSSVTGLGDGTVEVRWNSNDDTQVLLVRKTGDDFDSDFSTYGYRWLPLEGNGRMTVYYMAPGQSYWVLTMNSGTGYTGAWPYDVSRAPNFNEFSHPPKFSVFELRMRDSSGKVSKVDYFLASELEDMNNYNSYGVRFQVTWPDLRNSRTYFWQFVLELPDGERLVQYQEIVNMPKGGGYFWKSDYTPLEDMFHMVYDMRTEIPIGQYKYSLYWSGQHVASCDFWVR